MFMVRMDLFIEAQTWMVSLRNKTILIVYKSSLNKRWNLSSAKT